MSNRTYRDNPRHFPAEIGTEEMNLVASIVRKHFAGTDFLDDPDTSEDIFQEAFLAAVEAHRSYDPAKSNNFRRWMTDAVEYRLKNMFVSARGFARVKGYRPEVKLWSTWMAVQSKLEQRGGRAVSLQELREHLGVDPDEFYRVRELALAESEENHESLTEQFVLATNGEDDYNGSEDEHGNLSSLANNPDTLLAPLNTEDWVAMEELLEKLYEVVDGLTGDEKLIIQHKYGLQGAEEMTWAEIAEYMGYSASTVRRKASRAKRKICNRLGVAGEELLHLMNEIDGGGVYMVSEGH